VVTIKRSGANCQLINDKLSITLNGLGKATSLIFKGKELLTGLTGAPNDPDKNNSFYCDYHVAGGTVNLKPDRLEVIEETSHLVHIAYIDETSALQLAYHIILKENDSAIYSYVIASNDESEIEVNELRTVYRFNSDLFNIAYTHERQGMQPKTEHLTKYEKLQDETYRIPDGALYSNSQIYSKYDYAGYFKDNDFWGEYGNKYGFWFIPVDKSGYPSGPLKQDLLVHYDGILLNYMVGSHFGTLDFKVPHKWKKMYGPWCCYLNEGADLIEDAKKRVVKEQNKFPYSWVNENSELYPKELGDLEAKINTSKEIPETAHWMVVLSDQKGDYYHQKAGRIYYTDSDHDGKFKINNIRPNRYFVTAYIVGSTDSKTYDLGSIEIGTGRNNIELEVSNNILKCVWNVGLYSKTTAGFKFSNQLRNYIWKELVPKNLTYDVSQDHMSDWYYAQSDDGTWKIIFSKPENTKQYLLTFCLAGTTQKQMNPALGTSFNVYLNEKVISENRFENDRSAYRSTVTNGKSQQITIKLNQSEFLDGENVIAIKTDGYIMYDLIKLEEL
jgi:rhamnogalacturonan endolyase